MLDSKPIHFKQAAIYNTQLGLAYFKQGDRVHAKQKLIMALQQAPNLPEANAAMAFFLEQTGDINRAKVYYQNALRTAPGNGAQLNNYGAFLCRSGLYHQADAYFLRAINDKSYTHTAEAYENAGLCAAAIPNYTKAVNYFNKALKQDPLRKQALYELVSIEVKLGFNEKALAHLQAYQAISASDPAFQALAKAASKTR